MNILILASARSDSNTMRAVKQLSPVKEYVLIDLREKQIGHYDYNHDKNVGDDFLAIANEMSKSETIIFATPIYWYAMSGLLKVFFDRLTELLSTHKQIGKALKGKKIYVISTGSDPCPPAGFDNPFKLTAEYFEMEFAESLYLQIK